MEVQNAADFEYGAGMVVNGHMMRRDEDFGIHAFDMSALILDHAIVAFWAFAVL